MDQQTVVLVAAGVAALASLANVAVSVIFARRSTREAQVRDLLRPHITQLGVDLHQVVACCQMIAKRAGGPDRRPENTDAWFAKAHAACGRLKELHRCVKYPLGPIVDGIRELTRLANWVDHVKRDKPRRDDLLDAADALRQQLDDAIREAYLNGTLPSAAATARVRDATERLRRSWEDRPEEEAEPLQSLLADGRAVPGGPDQLPAAAPPSCAKNDGT